MLKCLMIVCLFVILNACETNGSLYCELSQAPFRTIVRLDYNYKRVTFYHEEVIIDLKEVDKKALDDYLKELDDYEIKNGDLYIYFDYDLNDPDDRLNFISNDEAATYFHLDLSEAAFVKKGFTCRKVEDKSDK